jgi:hypothetical protein
MFLLKSMTKLEDLTVLGHGRRITFIDQQHILVRLWTVQVYKHHSSCQQGGGWNKVGIKKYESIPTSSEEPSFDGLAHIVDENSIPPFKIDILWTKGDPIIVEISFFPPLRY